jgi:hypothetical protein
MPNWVYNQMTISHSDIDKMNAFRKVLDEDEGDNMLNFFEPNEENVSTRMGNNFEYEEEDGKFIITFETAWNPPTLELNKISDEGWLFRNVYCEEADQFIGVHTNDNGDNSEELPNGRRNLKRFIRDIEDNKELFDEHSDYLDNLLEQMEQYAEDSDYESEEDEEDTKTASECNYENPVTETSKIILEETKARIDKPPVDDNLYLEVWLINMWKKYVEDNPDHYDEKYFAIITTKGIKERINWKWICNELNK